MCQLLSEGQAGVAGVVFDAAFQEEQKELLGAINQKNLWSILDPRALELSTAGGFTDRRRTLPWAGRRPHTVADLEGAGGNALVEEISQYAILHGYSAILAPTHYLARGYSDPWFKVDIELLEHLRETLDRNGGKDVVIYYPLSFPTNVLFDEAQRIALKLAFKDTVSVDAIWLRVHPFGGHSGHITLQNYISSARDLQETDIPLVGEKVGAVGPALLAFGALGGLEVGVSSGESFNFGRLQKKVQPGRGFAPHRGVVFGDLGISLDTRLAKAFFENRTLRAQYSCKNVDCCRNGHADTLKEPRRHFMLTRIAEVSQLGAIPYRDRPSIYLEKFLRPATDKLGRVAQADISAALKKKVAHEQRKLSGWRNTLGLLSRTPIIQAARVPAKRVMRTRVVA